LPNLISGLAGGTEGEVQVVEFPSRTVLESSLGVATSILVFFVRWEKKEPMSEKN